MPEITPGDELTPLILEGCRRENLELVDGDVVVITQKIVSKAEGCIQSLSDVEPSSIATTFARESNKDPRLVELALREARRIVRWIAAS